MSLLLLTGCRPSEIRRLCWREVNSDRLALCDAKTGPRHVLLGEAARNLLDGPAESASKEWVFPGKNGSGPLTKNALYWLWTKARDRDRGRRAAAQPETRDGLLRRHERRPGAGRLAAARAQQSGDGPVLRPSCGQEHRGCRRGGPIIEDRLPTLITSTHESNTRVASLRQVIMYLPWNR